MTGHAPAATLRGDRGAGGDGASRSCSRPRTRSGSARSWRGASGCRCWQFALTATDANRFALRLARHVTGRPKVLVFNWCYHGTVDETFATLVDGGASCPRAATSARRSIRARRRKVVEFNDVDGARARARDRATSRCVLAEPALTNIGIVLPEPGFHDALRALTRETGTLLAIDETHTICAGPGGYTAAHGLEPDIAHDRQADRRRRAGGGLRVHGRAGRDGSTASIELEDVDVGGIGGTLAANALSLAAMRATLGDVLTEEAFARMIALAERWTRASRTASPSSGLPWHVTRLGCRAEYLFGPDRPRTGARGRTPPATSRSSATCTSTRSTAGSC